jgi:hypothetical protein
LFHFAAKNFKANISYIESVDPLDLDAFLVWVEGQECEKLEVIQTRWNADSAAYALRPVPPAIRRIESTILKLMVVARRDVIFMLNHSMEDNMQTIETALRTQFNGISELTRKDGYFESAAKILRTKSDQTKREISEVDELEIDRFKAANEEGRIAQVTELWRSLSDMNSTRRLEQNWFRETAQLLRTLLVMSFLDKVFEVVPKLESALKELKEAYGIEH